MEEQAPVAESPFANEPEGIIEGEEVNEELEEGNPEGELDEEESDESEYEEESEEEDELSDEEVDELLSELDDDTDEEIQTVPHAALHKERERRKEMQNALQNVSNEKLEAETRAKSYEDAFSDIEKQLKELGLEDVVKLDKPQAESKEAIAYKQQQQAQAQEQQVMQTVDNIRGEAAGYLADYPMIDGASTEHEEIVLGLSLAAIYFGSDVEDATVRAMKTLNSALGEKSKAAIRRQKPVAKKANAARSAKRVTKRQVKASSGNTSAFFDQMAENKFNS